MHALVWSHTTGLELTGTQEAHECHHDKLDLRAREPRQGDGADLDLLVLPSFGDLAGLSLVGGGIGRVYMMFCGVLCCRLLWKSVCDSAVCVGHGVA